MMGRLALMAATLAMATLGATLLRALHMPMGVILGALMGAALTANLFGVMSGGLIFRRSGQLFVGASIGAVLTPELIGELMGMLPTMIGIAIASNLVGLAVAWPLARLAGIDRLSATLASLPAGMAEMASLAGQLKADEAAVALIHTLRVILVLTLLPLWLGLTGKQAPPPILPADWHGFADILALVVVAGIGAAVATRFRVLNAFVIMPMLICLAIVAAGHPLPPVPRPILFAAQIGIGASIGLRFQLTQLARLPRVALAGALCATVMIGAAFSFLAPLAKMFAVLDPLSAALAAAPGGLGEMIGSAVSLNLLAASVAGFQLTRSLVTNLAAPPLIRWLYQGPPALVAVKTPSP